MEKTTPLTQWHIEHQGQMVPFGGYLMPVQYAHGILHEHHLVRQKAGLFDVSHMGELRLKGKDALANLHHLISNDYSDLQIGRIRYGILVQADGCAVDDLLVYKMADEDYFICVNASNIEKDEAYFRAHLFGEFTFENVSSHYGQIALQGPDSVKILSHLTQIIPSQYYSFNDHVRIEDIDVLVSRTGYTGEDGFELYVQAQDTVKLWELLLNVGEPYGLEPCGLGARDTLRLEAAMPLYGHELSEHITPLEAGLKMFTKPLTAGQIAQEVLSAEPKRRRIGLSLIDRGIAREGSPVLFQGEVVGQVTSGTHSPSLNKAIAMALVESRVVQETQFSIDVRGRILAAEKTKLPFYTRLNKEQK